MEILVFKTDIRYRKNIREVMPYLDQLDGITKWNVDFHDKDKILRVVSNNLSPRLIEYTLQTAGYSCEELKD